MARCDVRISRLQRAGRRRDRVTASDDEHMSNLVSNYLNRALSETRKKGVTGPFTHESLNVILKRSQGNARQVLSICSRVLDRAANTNRKEITGEFSRDSI